VPGLPEAMSELRIGEPSQAIRSFVRKWIASSEGTAADPGVSAANASLPNIRFGAETLQDARACGARRRTVVTDQVQMKADVKRTF
jgi:hypothetical protein